MSLQNADGTPWQPGEGDRVCSEHFISKKTADLPDNPDYVSSICPQETVKKFNGNSNSNTIAESLARFERALRHATVNKKEWIEKEKEEERVCSIVQ